MTAPEQMLKPCPFCGGEAEIDCMARNGEGVCVEPAICCASCHAIVILDFEAADYRAQAITAWNTRPAPAELVEALDDLQQAEAEYRLMHDRHGDGSRAAGRAWDLMRRAGDKARTALRNAGAAS